MNHLFLFFATLLLQPLLALASQTQMEEQSNYPSSTAPHVKHGTHLTLTGDFLWWKAQENGLDYVVWTDDPTQTDTTETQKLIPPDFDYDMGFRAGLGYQIPRDSWDVLVEWTRFHTTILSHRHVRTMNYGLITPWSSFLDVAETPFMHAHSHLQIHLDMIDAELGRNFCAGKRLSLRPSLGLRAIWVDQYEYLRNDTFFGPPIWKDQIKLTNDYRALGPKVSLETTWDLLWGFNLYGSGTLSLLYGEFKLKRNERVYYETAAMLPIQKRKTYQTIDLVRGMADIQIGLGWEIYFMRDRLHLSIRACWEQMIFFGQNQFLRLANPNLQGCTLSNLGDLSFEGGTLSARIDF